jgi:beta-galactosidase
VEYGLTKPEQLAEFYANNDAEMKQWVQRDYNHPSCVIWSLANEVWTKNEVPMLDHTYAQLRKLDPSGRPMTNSSGFHSVIRAQKGLTDIYDFHNYAMHSRYAWPVVYESVDADMQVLRDLYGKIDKPVIITESLAIWRPTEVKLKEITPALYVEHKGTRYIREIGLANLANRNDAYNQITGTWSIDVLEAFRQETLIQGFGPWFDNRFRLPQSITRVYGPNYVGFDVKNRPNAHHYAGESWRAELVVVHDAMTAMNARVQLQVHADSKASQPVATLSKPVTFADGDEKQTLGMQWDVPADLPAGDYVVDVQLLDDADHKLAHNSMSLKIAAPLHVTAMPNPSRVGVFVSDDLSASAVLDGLKRMVVPYTMVRDVKSLRDVDVLILPENWGKTVTKLPDALNAWVEQGGRLLAMAPGVNVPLGWLPGMEVMVGSNMRQPFVDCVQPSHPVLAGLAPSDFVDGFNGPDRMTVRSMIKPLTVNAILAAGSYSSDGQLAVLRDARIGKGAAIETTIDFTQRFSNDPVATKLLLNMLNYVISGQVLQYAPAIDATQLHPIREALADVALKDWRSISFFDVANAPLKNTLGSGSTLDYQHLPLGKQIMGLVPFTLATTPTQQAHAIIAMQGHRMPQLPPRVDGIVVGQQVQRLAFLQAAYYSAPGRIATYVVHYADGSTASVPVIGGENVGDWFSPRDLPGAIVAWEKPHPLITHATVGAYLMLWDNLKPDVKITTLDIISQGSEQQVGSTLMLLGLSAQQVGK